MAKFSLTAQLGLQAPSNTRQVVSQIQNALKGVSVNVNINVNTRQLSQVSNQLNSVNQSAKAANTSVSELGKTIGAAARRFGAISLVTGTFLGLSRSIKNSLGDAIEFERQMVILSQVTGKSVKQLNDLYGEVTRLATGFGVSSDSLLKTSIILAQAGLEARKTKGALEVLAKTQLAASFDDIASTTEGAIAILAQFKREAASAGGEIAFLEQSLESINQVSKKYAVESSDLVAVIRRSGGAFEAAGGSLNELLALFTSVRATTRESAETISTGLRTIFTRIQRVDTIRQLKDLGIELQDLEGKFVGPFEAIKRISEGLSSLDPRDFRFAQIVEELGGFRQISKVIPLIKQFGLAQDALNTAQSASGSLTQDAATAQQSLANQLTKVSEEFQALIRKFSDSEAFKSIAGGALEFARALIRIADAIEPLLPMIGALAAVNIGKGLVSAFSAFTGFGGMRGQRRNNGGKIYGFATGGMVPGSGNGDTVPAMLSPGEFVIRKASVKKFGAENLARLNKGGIAEAPLVDDLPNTKDAMKPRPGISTGSPLSEILRTGHGALDFDATLQRTTGDKAYARAKNDAQRQEVLSKYFRDSGARLNDAKSAKLTQFGQELQGLIKAGQIDPKKLTLISKSSRTPGLPEHVKSLFGIPIENMVFTSGGSKQPALDAFRQKGPRIDRIQRKALGGLIQKFAKGGEIAQQQSVGALILDDDKNVTKKTTAIITREFLKDKAKSANVDIDTIPGLGFGSKDGPSRQSKQYTLYRSGITDKGNIKTAIDEGINHGLATGITNATQKIANVSGLNFKVNQLSPSEAGKYINPGAKGTIFEEVIANISRGNSGDPFDKRADPNAPFDFIGDIGRAKELFAGTEAANQYYKDAKASNTAASKDEFEKKIANQIIAESPEYKKMGQEKAEKTKSLIDKLSAGPLKFSSSSDLKKILKDEYGLSENSLKTNASIEKTLEKNFGIKAIPTKISNSGQSSWELSKFAKGGGVSDTVPALLTPGEFVINKNTAQRVGYGKLHRLNKTGDVQGYAKGGVVGGVQRFSNGGGAKAFVPGDPSDLAKMIAELESIDKTLQKITNTEISPIKKSATDKGKITTKDADALAKVLGTSREEIEKQIKIDKESLDTKKKKNKIDIEALKAISQSAQQFVFLGATVAGLATQFSGLSDATSKALTETIAFGTTAIGVAGTVADLGASLYKTIFATAAETASTLANATADAAETGASTALTTAKGAEAVASSGVTLALGPFALAAIAIVGILAVLGGAFYFMKAKSKALAEEYSNQAKTLAADIESGKKAISEKETYVKKEKAAAEELANSYWFVSGVKEKEAAAAAAAANGFINVVAAISEFDKAITAIDADKSLNPAQKAAKKLEAFGKASADSSKEIIAASARRSNIASSFGKNADTVTKSDFATEGQFKEFEMLNQTLDKGGELLKSTFIKVQEQLQVGLEDAMSKTDFTKAAQDLNMDGVANAFDQVLEQNTAFANSLKTQSDLIMSNAQVLAQMQREAGNFIGAVATMNEAESQVKNLKKSYEAQSIAMAKAQAGATALAQTFQNTAKLGFVISKLNDYFTQVADNLDKFDKELNLISSVMDQEFANFEIPEIQGLDNIAKIKNLNKFNTQLDSLASMLGADGQAMASEVKAVAEVFKKSKNLLGKRFATLDTEDQAAGNTATSAIDAVLEPLKGFKSLEPLIASARASLLEAASGKSDSGATITQAEIEKALGPANEFVSQYTDLFEQINEVQRAQLKTLSSYVDKLSAAYQKEINFREQSVGIQQKGAERFSEATGEPLTRQQKEGFRTAKISARLGGAGLNPAIAGNAQALGATLKSLNAELLKTLRCR
jgi:hypothetical protein